MKGYNIFLKRKIIDTVFYDLPEGYQTKNEREEEVKRSLIEHDGYSYNIIVNEA